MTATPLSPAISVVDVLKGMARRKLMITLLTSCAFFGGIALVNYVKPIYSTESQVLVGNLESPFDRVQSLDNQAVPGVDDRVVESQMSVIKSQDLGRRVVAALNLTENKSFNPLLTPMGTVGKIKLALGFGEDPRLKTPDQLALGAFTEGLSVYQQPNSNVISIKYSTTDASIAASIANTLAETYILATRESQLQPTERARDWLATQIDALRTKLAESEQAVEQFRAEAGLLQGMTSTLAAQQVSELNTQITVAQTASAEAKARADAIRELLASKGSVDSSSEVLASPVVQRLKEQRTEAARVVGEISATYLPNHPKMIAAQNQLANIDRQIRAEALRIVAGLEEQARIAKARETSLRASLEELKARVSTANLDDVRLKALERDAAADRILLETMLSRYAEASARRDQAAQPGLARIIQTASVPTSPSFPKRGPMVLLITAAGLSFGLGLAFLIEIMAAAARLTERMAPARVQTRPASVESSVAAPPAADPIVPWQPAAAALAEQAPDAVPRAPDRLDAVDAQADARAKILLAWAAEAQRDAGAVRFAITSIGGGAGDTSLAAMTLARALAQSGHRAVIADLSRGGSWLEGLGGIASGPGIADLVTGEAAFTKVIGRDTRSPVHLLRFGQDHSPRAMAILDERIDSVLGALSQSYNVVIVHAGEAAPETPALLRKCDAALVLAAAERASEAAAAVRSLSGSGLKSARHMIIADRADAPTEPRQAVNA